MSNSIDQRVVQMQFDNAQFENGIRTTMDSLKNLDRALKLPGASQGIDNVNRSLAGISTTPLEDGCSRISSALSTISSVGRTAFDAVATGAKIAVGSVTALTLGLGALLTSQIISGGTKRASNIEHAKFQLKGLGVEWAEVQGDLDYAVKDTAYGLDEAAMAASQFLASGVHLGDDMKTALRSISGVAAMTNASYSDTARIFTTVAGNGRLMGDQLNQLGSRGLNAAAKLAEYFNKVNDGSIDATDSVREMVKTITEGAEVSEESIRDMTSKGKINFELFAAAMDSLFGEHAKEANKTFDGALANMKASLSRIGADFIMPLHEGERQAFLGLRAIFDNVRKGLNANTEIYIAGFKRRTSIVTQFSNTMTKSGSMIQQSLERIAGTNILKDFFAAFTPLVSLSLDSGYINLLSFLEVLEDSISKLPTKELLEFNNAFAEAMRPIARDFAKSIVPGMQAIGDIVSSIANIVQLIGTAVAPVVQSFFEVFLGGSFTETAKSFKSITQSLVDLTSGLSFSEQQLAGIKNLFDAVFGVIKQIGSGIGKVFAPIIDFAGYLAGGIWEGFLGVLDKLAGLSISDTGIGVFFDDISAGLSSFFGAIKEVINPVELIGSFFSSFEGILSQTFSVLSSGGNAAIFLLNGIADAISALINAVKNSSIIQAFGEALSSLSGVVSFHNIMLALQGAFGAGLLTSVTQLNVALSRALSFLGKLGNNEYSLKHFLGLGPAVDKFKNAFIAFESNMKFTNILKIAAAIGILAISFKLLSSIDAPSLIAAGVALGYISFVVMTLASSSALTNLMKTPGSGAGLVTIAISLILMATALSTLSKIDLSALPAAMTGMLVAVGALGAMAAILSQLDRGIGFSSAGLISIAVALIATAAALKIMSSIPFDRLGSGLIGMTVVVGALGGLALILGKVGPKIIFGGVAVAAMSASMLAISAALVILAAIPFDRLQSALIGLISSVAAISLALAFISMLGPKIMAGGIAITLASAGLVAIAGALAIMSTISSDSMGNALAGLASALLALSVALYAMRGSAVGAVALTIAAAGLLLLVPSLAALSAIPILPLGIALGVLVAGLALLGVVARTLAVPLLTLAGVFLAAGTAMALFGAGVALVGVGFAAFVGALASLVVIAATGAGVIAEAIKQLLLELLSLFGEVGSALGDLIVGFLVSLAEHSVELNEAGTKLMLSFLESIKTVIPAIVDCGLAIVDGILSAINRHMDNIVQSGIDIMVSFMTGLAKGIINNRERVIAAALMIGAAIVTAIVDTLADLVSMIPGVGEGMADAMRGMADDLESAAYDSMDKAEAAYAEKTGNIVQNTEQMTHDVQHAIEDGGPGIADASGALATQMSDEFGIDIHKLPQMTSEELDALQAQISSSGLPIDIRNLASSMGTEFDTGIGSLPWSAQKAASGVDGALAAAGSNAYSIGTTTGYNYSAGVADGVNWGAFLARGAAYAVGLGMNAAAQAGLWEHSPSRKGFIVGMNYDLGIAQGVDKYASAPISSTEGMVFGILDATAGLAASIAAEMDELNASPTITPVFDTSSVTEGMAMLDAMMMQKQIMMAGWADAQPIYDPVTQSRADTQAQTVYNTYLDYNADSSATDMVRDMTRKFKMANLLGG